MRGSLDFNNGKKSLTEYKSLDVIRCTYVHNRFSFKYIILHIMQYSKCAHNDVWDDCNFRAISLRRWSLWALNADYRCIEIKYEILWSTTIQSHGGAYPSDFHRTHHYWRCDDIQTLNAMKATIQRKFSSAVSVLLSVYL